jgi:Ca2+-binding RTX toxin-like protein
MWALNPGQEQYEYGYGYILGGNGQDILYGAPQGLDKYGREVLYGDHFNANSLEGDDDIIYTGDSPEHTSTDYSGDKAYGGAGNDKIYGQGYARHTLFGSDGDDYVVGGKGNDRLYGDAYVTAPFFIEATGAPFDDSTTKGDDTIHGGEGDDFILAGPGDDYVYGDEGSDTLYGSYGDDTLWGGDGTDYIYTGFGWDTVFGGDGCDNIFSNDGGDVIWAGDCDPDADEETLQH